jgi:hypothetical protein
MNVTAQLFAASGPAASFASATAASWLPTCSFVNTERICARTVASDTPSSAAYLPSASRSSTSRSRTLSLSSLAMTSCCLPAWRWWSWTNSARAAADNTGYDWDFVADPATPFPDSGNADCR